MTQTTRAVILPEIKNQILKKIAGYPGKNQDSGSSEKGDSTVGGGGIGRGGAGGADNNLGAEGTAGTSSGGSGGRTSPGQVTADPEDEEPAPKGG